MKPEDLARHSAHLVKFLVTSVISQEDALAIASDILNEKGAEMVKARCEFKELDEK